MSSQGDQYSPFIITSSTAVSFWVHLRDYLLTFFLWGFYIYLLRDFFVFMGRVISWGWEKFDATLGLCAKDCQQTIVIPPDMKIMHTLEGYVYVVIAMGCLLIAWALYNQIRFGNKTRRKTPHSISLKELAVMYHASTTDIEAWQQARILTVHHDQNGVLTKVDI